MNLKTLAFATLTLAAAAAGAQTTVSASHSYQIEDAGSAGTGAGYTYSSDSKYFDMGVNATYKSFGVLDFSAASLAGDSITGATLTLGNGTYASSKTTVLSLFAVTDTQTNLAKVSGTPPVGNQTVTYNDSVVGGYTNQLGTATLLGTYTFNPDTTLTDLYTIPLSQNFSALTSQIGSGTLRILITTDEQGYATLGGVGSGTPAVPSLALKVQSTPEPSAFAALGLGAVAFVRRRRSTK